MGRRKIEIKAIKDDRNRSVTFLKRKGGLFKKAHELSVLCSVDVAVFIFGSNKKLYEYSSCDMRELINRYAYHGGPNEHKGPSDFNGGADEDEDEDENGTPPQGDGMDAHMLPPHFTGQAPFPQIRHHTPGASPPIPNGMFGPHPVHPVARGHTPQPQMGSRPSSRNDIRRVGPGMMPQAVGPSGPPPPPAVNGFAYMPQPAIYNPQNQPGMAMPPQVHPTYPFSGPPPHPQMQAFVDEQRRSSVPPAFPQGPQGTPPVPRHSASPPQPHHQVPPQAVPHMSPPPPQIHLHPMQSPPQPQMQQPQIQHPSPPQMHEPPRAQPHQEYQPPAPVEPKTEPVSRPVVKAEVVEKPRQSLLLDTGVKKHKGSIFTPIDENRSILSQHLAAFQPEVKSESIGSRLQSIDAAKSGNTASPPRSNGSSLAQRNGSISSIPETTFTPPSRSNSLRVGTPVTARPRLKVQIPDEPSDAGSATAESSSPRGTATDAASQSSRRLTDSHSSGPVLPPPSPSASAILSAGATGPPNPFARPIPPQNNGSMNVDTPASALPSRFLNGEFLPSPSSFYPDWNFRGAESNTLPSPLNFATPVAGNGPSFLRDDPIPLKRKSPEMSGSSLAHDHMDAGNEPKRVKVDS